ncbi:MAG: ABC transporter ATP-binding protein [Roseitalea sp.]|nr:ABC transporter ATP-binding protein [Roseitalea sp.]MBO6721679.1 ABC transporter ATP-binding protein [Roseitalea sp.]MBO6743533.1 ABC transporter ATP-binding protein [Roseitalea sp.]
MAAFATCTTSDIAANRRDQGQTPVPEPAFTTHRLTKVYGEGRSAVHALRGVDLEIPGGEIVVLLGPSGSGKSTLLNIIGGLDRATDGSAHFRDRNLSQMTDSQLTRYRRDHVGFVFQFYNLMPSLTAHENVELVTEIARDPMDPEEALALVGLRERVDHFPAQLSGGEQQRVAIARAIAKQPDVLFCDEPTGALDSQTGRAVLEVIRDVNETLGSTVLMVTHAANTAQMADRVIHFADGALREVVVNDTKLSPAEIDW